MAKRVIEVGAAVIYRNGEILITSRPDGREFAGAWEFPGGKIERGESMARCLERELLEELNLEIRVFDQMYQTLYEYPERFVRLYFIRCQMRHADAVPQPQEGQQWRWIAQNRLNEAGLLPADREFADFLTIFS